MSKRVKTPTEKSKGQAALHLSERRSSPRIAAKNNEERRSSPRLAAKKKKKMLDLRAPQAKRGMRWKIYVYAIPK